MKKIFFSLFPLWFVAACSSSPVEEKVTSLSVESSASTALPGALVIEQNNLAQEKTLAPTPLPLSPEEQKRLSVLEHYRQLRLLDAEKKKFSKTALIRPNNYRAPVIRSLPSIPSTTPITNHSPALANNHSALGIELEQHQNYFCIKHVGKRLANETSCRLLVQEWLDLCWKDQKSEEKAPLNRRIVDCFKLKVRSFR